MKIEYRRVNHIIIAAPAGEHQKVRAFYGGVLGLKEVERPEALNKVFDLIWYEWMDVLLHIDFTPPWFKPAENRRVAAADDVIGAIAHKIASIFVSFAANLIAFMPCPNRPML
jgi:hypothetical protein